ncbi:hypothetical protein EDEG_00166 [Edhazardia aedis USNM 41457]|uniref:PHD-type domain-containing protein n=1 Tax=Edhazardia aedis (strain USNM 41457) TaxID=1003232 RepID=J8ZVK2_EDHAE|nr:hypothetical protein EDEG_00166 [Edhazardia aedis USNM 41457]|eukprot:EJW03678.1 hypothetical protein EDEG_00166 [Edhazardia aedis USNM 41457]
MTPIDVLDDVLNSLQTLPLKCKHYTKQILVNDKIISKKTKKRDKLIKKLLKDPNNGIFQKKFSRYQIAIEKAISNKIKVAENMKNIIAEIRTDFCEKVTQLEEKIILDDSSLRLVIVDKIDAFDNEEKTYCICNKKSTDDMIACDNNECKIGWFHFGCVGLLSAPHGSWFCDNCKKKKSRTSRNSQGN